LYVTISVIIHYSLRYHWMV